MEIIATAIPEVSILVPARRRDERGVFAETWNARDLAAAGIGAAFVQDNHICSPRPGTLRGLHFQAPPHAQGKLVRVLRGAIFDVALDLRAGAPTFGRHVTAHLSRDNWRQIWIPAGFAHGYCTLEPDTEVLYKVTEYWAPESAAGIRWDDPALAIAWPLPAAALTIAAADRAWPSLADLPPFFADERAR